MTLPPDQARLLDTLGPRSAEWLRRDGARLLQQRLDEGSSARDALLGAVFDGARCAPSREEREQLGAEFWGHVARLLKRLGGDAAQPSDDLESALVAVWMDPADLEFRNERQLLAYLRRRSSWRVRARRANSRAVLLDDMIQVSERGPGPATRAGQAMDTERLYERITALPERERKLVLWRIAGVPSSEQATRLGISESACRRSVRRALARLDRPDSGS